jgi:beta-aspartyl-peptidase (threonine type)
MQVIVHGGAGGTPDEPGPRQVVLDDAAVRGAGESTPLDAVEAAVRVLESSERFNAGVGGAVQSDGAIRTDAGIMTDDRAAGAVSSMPGVEHAVSAARIVHEETPHVLVSGEQAVALADEYGVETGVDLRSARTRERWADLDPPVDAGPREQLAWLRDQFGRTDPGGREAEGDGARNDRSDGARNDRSDGARSERGGDFANGTPPGHRDEHDHDTVGAVAREGDRLAAATSTGGRWLALAGRVGDVPQIGSGFYCTPAAGASATGAGEDIARVTLTRRAVQHVEQGCDAADAASLAVEEFGELTDSSAGVIVLDAHGTAGSAFNSDAMQTAIARR